ncbi:hypothetical protein MPTK1_1g18260 [Marchantia polymorpha subsp. ruderalis]|uniref:Uncharacterized protein n=2 Tax=Marchantia polymorpha TaxID=3197 RepID=A0A176WA71_MARPO|nr:hypothetical protein AXG93_773s1690 [Marchantia polymorpha subsp. ruderalis]PTQ50122.1 hypothetical protein MARPO_0001s0164 [Marchantia polymorpha]BBM99046.1 hypothetical protein Mp_1g18260 [Marchantia polymorpha subsp. ruderalis]|eukprot:PTQ50122.1 hypothetical protein MARPO_0001s0164 [Marchantia polymorpha]
MSTTEAQQADLNAAAADLQKTASDVINSAGAAGEDAKASAGSKREALLNVANIVKDQASKGIDTSKAYIDRVVDHVGTFAQQATDKASTQIGGLQSTATAQLASLQENLAKAIKAGQTSGTSSTPAADGTTTDRSYTPAAADGSGSGANDAMKFPFNVVTWCSTVCGGKDGAAPAFNARGLSPDALREAAASVQASLESGQASLTEQAKAAAASAKEKASAAAAQAQEAAQSAQEKAQAASAQVQEAVSAKAAEAQEAAAQEQKSLAEQGQAAKDAAVAEASAVKEQVEAKVAEVQSQVSGAGAPAAPSS